MSSLKLANEPSRALAMVGRYTRGRVRSTQEVLAYLRRRGVPSATAARVIVACRARGMLDDGACARLWADHWARQGYAAAVIRQKLAAKGFDDSTLNDVTIRLLSPTDEEARARQVLARRASRAPGPTARARLARILTSRGFDPDLIERLLNPSVSVHLDAE